MAISGLFNQFEVGVVGLDSCGRKLTRVLAEHHLGVVAFDCHEENIQALRDEAPDASIRIAASLMEFLELLRPHRTILLSGPDVGGDTFEDLLAQLQTDDLLIDAGDCYFKDCARRAGLLADHNVRYLDVGVLRNEDQESGDPILMAGGRLETYQSVRLLLETILDGRSGPLVDRLGPESPVILSK